MGSGSGAPDQAAAAAWSAHLVPDQVSALVGRIEAGQGALDVLVNPCARP
jgi:hypothetical protein